MGEKGKGYLGVRGKSDVYGVNGRVRDEVGVR